MMYAFVLYCFKLLRIIFNYLLTVNIAGLASSVARGASACCSGIRRCCSADDQYDHTTFTVHNHHFCTIADIDGDLFTDVLVQLERRPVTVDDVIADQLDQAAFYMYNARCLGGSDVNIPKLRTLLNFWCNEYPGRRHRCRRMNSTTQTNGHEFSATAAAAASAAATATAAATANAAANPYADYSAMTRWAKSASIVHLLAHPVIYEAVDRGLLMIRPAEPDEVAVGEVAASRNYHNRASRPAAGQPRHGQGCACRPQNMEPIMELPAEELPPGLTGPRALSIERFPISVETNNGSDDPSSPSSITVIVDPGTDDEFDNEIPFGLVELLKVAKAMSGQPPNNMFG